MMDIPCMMDKHEIHEVEPNLADDLVGGIWTECDASATPMAVAFAFIEEAKKLGAKVFTQCPIKGIKLDEKGMWKLP